MKANELRIGNIVTDESFDSFKKIITIESINDKGINLEITDDGYWSDLAQHFINPEYEFSQLRGVPLSDEILLNVGFVNEFSNSWSDHILQIFQNKGNVAGADIGDFYVSTGQRYVTNFKHLHQLQNIYFALTGQELNTSGL